ncbi:MAG: sigma-70 region 4 domain protein [Thermoleophilia bacterium]|nr:sigma-70 region 4 domain protein [Thermoleophilia bacterium]
MSPTDLDFQVLLGSARGGDDGAWHELYLRHASPVLGYLRSQRAPSPEDLLGEVWLQAVRDLGRFEGDERGFHAWLLSIAHHRLLDARRTSTRRPVEVGVEPGESAVDGRALPGEQLLAEQELGELLDGLPERQRSLLYLRFVLDLPQAEVARVMGLSTPAVKMLQGRSLRALEKRVRELDRLDVRIRSLPFDDTGRSGQ